MASTVLNTSCPALNNDYVDPTTGVYYNPRLDPKNYLEGALSSNPATRLRQMLAHPALSLLLEFVMELVPGVPSKPAPIASINLVLPQPHLGWVDRI